VSSNNHYEIVYMEDSWDCETCGSDYASGYQIFLDDVLVVDKHPIAYCYNGSSYDDSEAYKDILELEGIKITESYSVPDEYPDPEYE